jgi:hypothetical protein
VVVSLGRPRQVVLSVTALIAATLGINGVLASKSQSIVFEVPQGVTFGEAPFVVNASASSGLPVNVDLVDGPCTLNGHAVSVTGVGVCTFTLTQPGDGWRGPVTLTKSLEISKADQTVSIIGPTTATYHDAPLSLSASSSARLPVTLSASGACGLDGTMLVIQRAGPCVIKAAQPGNDHYNQGTRELTIMVSKAAQSSVLAQIPASATYGDGPFTVSAQASSGLSVNFSASGACAANGSVISIHGAGTCTIAANQSGNENWQPAPAVTRSLMIAKADQTIKLVVPGPISYGGSSVTIAGTSSSPLPVASSVAGACTMSNGVIRAKGFIGTDVCTVTATQAGDSNFNPARPVVQRVTVIGLSWTCCRVIYAPPGDFCSYFGCIGNFGNSAGYVMQCRDGLFSTAGGRSGSCSGHGGNARAIYAP